MTKKSRYSPPIASKDDLAHTTARAGISAIPLVGGPILEFFNLLLVPSLERRRQKWMEQVAEGLQRLEEAERLTLEGLKGNESFISTVMHATQAAIRTHQQAKLDYLRNAVLNAALPDSPEDSLQVVFLNFIDSFTAWHLKILELFNDPPGRAKRHHHSFPEHDSGSLQSVLESAFPVMSSQRMLSDQVWRDLYARGLVGNESLHGLKTGEGLIAQRTTDFGRKFLQFIMDPT